MLSKLFVTYVVLFMKYSESISPYRNFQLELEDSALSDKNHPPIEKSISQKGDYYVVDFKIGNKILNLNLATGTGVTWVTSNSCKYCGNSTTACTKQATKFKLGQELPIDLLNTSYPGNEFVTGKYYNLFVPMRTIKNITKHVNFNIGIVDTLSSNYGSREFDGILGLALKADDISTQFEDPRHKSFIDILNSNSFFTDQMFSIWLSDKITNKTGRLIIGGRDKKCSSTQLTLNSNNQTYWRLNVESAFFNNNNTKLANSAGQATLDSGYPFIKMPQCAYKSMNKLYNISKAFSCDKIPSFNLILQIGTFSITITSSKLAYKTATNEACKFALESGEKNGPWTLGQPLYRSYCVLHNFAAKSITFDNIPTTSSSPIF